MQLSNKNGGRENRPIPERAPATPVPKLHERGRFSGSGAHGGSVLAQFVSRNVKWNPLRWRAPALNAVLRRYRDYSCLVRTMLGFVRTVRNTSPKTAAATHRNLTWRPKFRWGFPSQPRRGHHWDRRARLRSYDGRKVVWIAGDILRIDTTVFIRRSLRSA
jgi:hypothetical protein